MLSNEQVDFLVRHDLGGYRYYPRLTVEAARGHHGGIILIVPPSPGGRISLGATFKITRSDAIALARQLMELAE